jgi:hypothetical protein
VILFHYRAFSFTIYDLRAVPSAGQRASIHLNPPQGKTREGHTFCVRFTRAEKSDLESELKKAQSQIGTIYAPASVQQKNYLNTEIGRKEM